MLNAPPIQSSSRFLYLLCVAAAAGRVCTLTAASSSTATEPSIRSPDAMMLGIDDGKLLLEVLCGSLWLLFAEASVVTTLLPGRMLYISLDGDDWTF